MAMSMLSLPMTWHHHRPFVAHHFGMLINLEPAGVKVREIGGQHADAMRIMAGQVGHDQIVGDQFGFVIGRARRLAHGTDDSAEGFGGDNGHVQMLCATGGRDSAHVRALNG
jgi:hypothetical protein